MNWKHQQNIYHAYDDGNLMVENLIEIKNGIKTCVDVSAKIQENIMSPEKIISGILVHVLSYRNCSNKF